MRHFVTSVLFFLYSSVILFGQTLPASKAPASVAPRFPQKTDPAQYVGSQRCQTCHRAESLVFARTAHADLTAVNDTSVTGCEMCHGPGKPHADAEEAAGDDDAKVKAATKLIFAFHGNPRDNAQRCMGCHVSSRDQARYDRSSHLQHGVACSSCHSMHLVEAVRTPEAKRQGSAQATFFNVPKIAEGERWLHNSQLTKPQTELCGGCHLNVQAQFALPSHHRVPEGAVKCTDCHNAHDSLNPNTLRQVAWQSCATCHPEKVGPFVFNHPAVKVQGCTACHIPHGSVNKMLLNRREERFLCLQCHVDPAAANVPHSRLSFQTRGDCTRCHSAIHGSNFDPNYLN